MFQLVSREIWKGRIEAGAVIIIARAHLSQQESVHPLGVSTYGMSIAGSRQVDSWGVVSPSEHWATNGSYVLRSIVILLYSGMLVQFGLIGLSLISFSVKRIFQFCFVKRSGNKSAKCFSLPLFFNLVVSPVGGLSRLCVCSN
jgi:hypothetical protein